MDTDDFEDMLFGLDTSCDGLEDAASDISEDEMLDTPDDGFNLYSLEDSPSLISAATDHEVDEHINMKEPEMRSRQEPPAFDAIRPARDR
jgi:hypothetical protein